MGARRECSSAQVSVQKADANLGHQATHPTDVSFVMTNGGNSSTTIDAVNFANANPATQTGVVVHEWFHTMQINNSVIFQVRAGFANILQSLGGRNSVEDEATAAAAEALQKCGPG